jgi:DNA (cytosine-5)-methyltransferase 1
MKVVELFCGAGGMGLGLTRAGMKIHRAYDNWRPALAVHRANLSKRIDLSVQFSRTWVGDLADLTRAVPGIIRLRPDVIAGGPPCQDYSKLNQKRAKKRTGSRADLTSGFAVIVGGVRPAYFIMENVPDAQGAEAYARAKIIFRHAGYGLTERVLDASWYGVATARERLFVIGCLGEADDFLGEHLDAERHARQTTVADVLGHDFGKDYDARGRLFWFPPNGGKSAGTRSVAKPVPTITGKTLVNTRNTYRPKRVDVADWETLIQPTPEQFSLLQGFPQGWNWQPAGSLSAQSQMLANSIPPAVAEVIGRCILAHSRGERPEIPREFPAHFEDWLGERHVGKPLHDAKSLFRAVQKLLGPAATGPLEKALDLLNRHPALASASPQRRGNLAGALRLYDECVMDFIRDGRPPFDARR